MVRWPWSGEIETESLLPALPHELRERSLKDLQLLRRHEKRRVEHQRTASTHGFLRVGDSRNRRANRLERVLRQLVDDVVDDLLRHGTHLGALLPLELALQEVALAGCG